MAENSYVRLFAYTALLFALVFYAGSEFIADHGLEDDIAEGVSALKDENTRSTAFNQMSADTRTRVKEFADGFFNRLPKDDEERQNLTENVASNICQNTDPINLGAVEGAKLTGRQAKRMKYAVEVINENFDKELETGVFEEISEKSYDVARYTPVIKSYNQLSREACKVGAGDKESIEDFYLSTMSFGLGVFLIQERVIYHSSAVGAHMVGTAFGLRHLKEICGESCYALALQEIHWALKGKLWGAKEYVFDKMREDGVDTTLNEISAYLNQTGR